MKESFAVTRLLAAALVVLPLVAASACSKRSGPPRAVVETTQVDLGVRAPGEQAVAKFTVRNDGGEPLQIEVGEPRPSLPSIRAEVSGAPVDPGDEATVSLWLDTAALVGSRSYSVPVGTNDPATPGMSLQATLDVRPMLVVDPPAVRYAAVEGDHDAQVAQTLWSTDGATFRVLRVEPPNPDVRVEFAEAKPEERHGDAAGSQWRIVSTLPADATRSSVLGNLIVVTDHPRQQRLRIPVSGRVKPMLAAMPPVVVLGRVEPGEQRHVTVTLRASGSREVSIDRVTPTVPGLAVEVEPVTPGKVYRLHVSTTDELAEGTVDGTIDVHASGERPRTFSIKVRGEVARRAAEGSGTAG